MGESKRLVNGFCGALAAACLLLASSAAQAATAQRPYKNFSVAIYIPVFSTNQLADPKVLQQQFDRIWSQVHFNKVYLEDYRSGLFADPAALDRIARFFRAHGITVNGGITLTAADQCGPFRSFDYENPKDIATAKRAIREAASHFDTVILDDFTFYNTRSDADIRAKGSQSWTEYRLRKMRQVAQHLILGTARSVNPHVKVIIKYPNWYEHFQGLGFDLDHEAQMFDYIYTGTETRDPVETYQLLQQYESYLIYRYYSNIRPDGGNLGGWVDTFETRYADRYAEQLWDTMFAKSPEITLFSWTQLASAAPAIAGDRPGPVTPPASTGTRWRAPSRRRRGAKRCPAGRTWRGMRSTRSIPSSASSDRRSASRATSPTSRPPTRTSCRTISATSAFRWISRRASPRVRPSSC